MNNSMYIAATGMQMQQASVDTLANNLANVGTPGFKRSRVSFQDLVYRDMGGARTAASQASQGAAPSMWQGSGVGMAGIVKAFAGGELKQTGQSLDFAVRGDGFFEVTAADGTPAFTRGGSLVVDKEGYLATSEGYQLRPAIHVGTEASELSVTAAGVVSAKLAGQSSATELGRIELARFADTSGLQAMGGNMYRPSAASGDAIYGAAGEGGMGTVAQGWLEGSNVNLVDEMVSLMVAQRAYESSVKVIQASDEMLAMSNNLRK